MILLSARGYSAYEIAKIDQAIARAGPETTVLFEDETDLRRFPPLRKAWMPLGEQRSVPVPAENGKFTLYGALDVLTGEVIVEPYPKPKYTKAFLRALLRQIKGSIVFIWDRACWHTSQAVASLLHAHDRLEVLPLPKRSPEDNPIEDLWRVLKNQVANLERSLEVLQAACCRFFDELMPKQALKTNILI